VWCSCRLQAKNVFMMPKEKHEAGTGSSRPLEPGSWSRRMMVRARTIGGGSTIFPSGANGQAFDMFHQSDAMMTKLNHGRGEEDGGVKAG